MGGLYRIPGPYGVDFRYGCILHPGPTGIRQRGLDDFPVHLPGPIDGQNTTAAVADAAKQAASADTSELELLVAVFGTMKNKQNTKAYVYYDKKKKKKMYRVNEYVADRNTFFGSASSYLDFLAAARGELDADNGKLRKFIEPPNAARAKHAQWRSAQDVFYAWVRKAYQNKLGDKADVPKLIKANMSEALKLALAKVKLDYGKEFTYGGFNPRPQKHEGYTLGTLSDHALGTAIDIEANRNAQILETRWALILKYTDKALTHSERKSRWKSAPKDLYDGIVDINNVFVSNLAAAIKATEEAARKSAEAPGATAKDKDTAAAIRKDPLAAAVAQDPTLKSIGISFIKEWRNGFFALPWDLVKVLHDDGFLWGATFSDPDLHHFQL